MVQNDTEHLTNHTFLRDDATNELMLVVSAFDTAPMDNPSIFVSWNDNSIMLNRGGDETFVLDPVTDQAILETLRQTKTLLVVEADPKGPPFDPQKGQIGKLQYHAMVHLMDRPVAATLATLSN